MSRDVEAPIKTWDLLKVMNLLALAAAHVGRLRTRDAETLVK